MLGKTLVFGPYCVRDSLYGGAHVQAHLNAVARVMRDRVRKTRHTVITVAQDFNTQTVILLQRARGKSEKSQTQEKIQ